MTTGYYFGFIVLKRHLLGDKEMDCRYIFGDIINMNL